MRYHVRHIVRVKQSVDVHPATTADGRLFKPLAFLHPRISGTVTVTVYSESIYPET